MSLYKFIEKKLPEVGLTMKQLAENEGINYTTINRIKAGGTILDGTKQKLAKGLKCSVGDINAAIAQLDDGPAPEKVPIKWHEDQKTEDIVLPDTPLRVTKIPADVNVEMYKAHLREMLIKRMAEIRMTASVADVYTDFGRMVAQELI